MVPAFGGSSGGDLQTLNGPQTLHPGRVANPASNFPQYGSRRGTRAEWVLSSG